ncbi:MULTISPECIES: TetR/AcrR family transcriptional regulator [Leifsonia]|uniref:TetR/AcrR family transcriptional regulator n=1 Tax=Leifsonia virtsii TaxID=3035915 RepID=A0ABT8J1D2_9MICO|nr:TetR/AcrR family transcriptional regulator [Leifsonia virtsii]MDN4598894.1 TetR/AcrR family transcriptional regulator [Leifsonia virtsii]NUU06951.1 TetR/AcrR family transcriptional regulator [Leifsonia sp. C5G2]
MGRTPDPNRKPELLGRIMDHVATEPLSRMTFRSLASALGVSTYSFVYHFGSRQEMIDAILEEGVRQQSESLVGVDVTAFDRDQFRDWYKEAFRHSLRENNRTALRLQFEAGALEPIDPDIGKRITTAFTGWRDTVKSWLKKQGVETRRAGVLAHWLVDSAAGLHFGYLMSGDRTATVHAFDVFLDAFLREAFGD